MVDLKYSTNRREISEGVTVLHNLKKSETGLEYIETKILEIESNKFFEENTADQEVCIVILTGKATVVAGEKEFKHLGTRENVFEKIPTDSVYISINEKFKIVAETKSKIIICYSPAKEKRETRLIAASDNSIENRGIKNNKRLVHNILPDDVMIPENLLVVEVYTDSGNWSSYPPHKHDQNNLPEESLLEETYYHEMNPSQGFVFQRVYTDDLSLDETMTVENGDVVVVPKGYHPVGVPDGYDSYYLNIMAGPIRKWKFYNDPKHEWILKRKD